MAVVPGLRVFALIAALLLMAGCQPTVNFTGARVSADQPLPLAKPEPPLVPAKPSAVRGAKVFEAQCAICHGPQGKGDGPAGSGLTTPGRDVIVDFLAIFGIKHEIEKLPSRPANFHVVEQQRLNHPYMNWETVSQGRPYTAMPAFGPKVGYGANKAQTLSDQERWDLVFHEWQWATTPERLARAKEIYETRGIDGQTCAACHGTAGDGKGPKGAEMAGRLWMWKAGRGPGVFTDFNYLVQRKPSQIFQVIKEGSLNRLMPAYGKKLTEDEMWMLVEYAYTFIYEPRPK
ncbi:MAG: c-type cytochrome [Armatimonadetes bacterium]|nr:c-type cytochrome [Armatimonadota bacterium]